MNINRTIAESLGWITEQTSMGWRVKSPTGIKWGMLEASSGDEIWEYHTNLGNLPDFEHDLNAAWSLFLLLPDYYVLWQGGVVKDDQVIASSYLSPARAICVAYCQVKGIAIPEE